MLSRDLRGLESEFEARLGETFELGPEAVAVLYGAFGDMAQRAEAMECLIVPTPARGPVLGPRLVYEAGDRPRACKEPPWGWGPSGPPTSSLAKPEEVR
jgi:hypothetical protein